MVIGTLDRQRAYYAMEHLRTPAYVARRPLTFARDCRTCVIRGVGVQALLNSAGRHTHRLSAHRRLDRLKIPVLNRTRPYERLDLRNDLGREPPFEALFLAASSEAASVFSNWLSAHCSHACQ